MKIEVLYFDGCPNHKPSLERVRQVLAEEGLFAEVLEVNVSEPSIAQKVGFLGSPSIRVNGLDVEPEARSERAYGMMCRTYAVNGRREGLRDVAPSDARREFQYGCGAKVLMWSAR
jgi:hypothetical protein